MDPFIGQLALFPYNFAPAGWMQCSGQILPIAQYSALFSLLGTNFGGNGTTNFAVPDLRGRAAIGAGAGPGLTPVQIGEAGGEEQVALLQSTVPGHSHALPASTTIAATASPAGAVPGQGAHIGGRGSTVTVDLYTAPTSSPVALAAAACGPAGGGSGTPHTNIQPYLALNWCIALNGIFPPRQ